MPFRVKTCKSFKKYAPPMPTIGVHTVTKPVQLQVVSPKVESIDIEEFDREYEAFIANLHKQQAIRKQTRVLENYE